MPKLNSLNRSVAPAITLIYIKGWSLKSVSLEYKTDSVLNSIEFYGLSRLKQTAQPFCSSIDLVKL